MNELEIKKLCDQIRVTAFGIQKYLRHQIKKYIFNNS